MVMNLIRMSWLGWSAGRCPCAGDVLGKTRVMKIKKVKAYSREGVQQVQRSWGKY